MKMKYVFCAIFLWFTLACFAAQAEELQVVSFGENPSCRALIGLTHDKAVKLEKTFYQDFSKHGLEDGHWQTHFLGSSKWPEAMYWGGKGSNIKRQFAPAGEQEIYVDPLYRGLSDRKPLGLNPFKHENGVLKIVASRTPPEMLDDLFGNPYISGVLTTAGWFEQLYGYFEIEAKLPYGQAVWPAFWLLPSDTSWPPEIDVFEGRGQVHGQFAMSTHWTDPGTGKQKTCSVEKNIPDIDTAFHKYGVLWQPEGITYLIDRVPVYQIPSPPGFDKPMYMLVNIAIGSTVMHNVGRVTDGTPNPVVMSIKQLSAYKTLP
jgi:beta-glucanase (GH16 family)